MTELQLGKYEFYPYEFDKEKTQDLEEIVRRREEKKGVSQHRKDKLVQQRGKKKV
ncbi:MAG: hypothetical protein KF855_04900 [Acidobacteria bacterium]|nr:hypothetical protein [Acidobacteriota bacterium]